MYWNKRYETFCIVINNLLSIVINIQNTTIFEPVFLTGYYTTIYIYIYIHTHTHTDMHKGTFRKTEVKQG